VGVDNAISQLIDLPNINLLFAFSWGFSSNSFSIFIVFALIYETSF
jgi:hypothetical protein